MAEQLRSTDYTPTEWRIKVRLSDGLWHSKAEIHTLMDDDLSDINVVTVWITQLRKKLRKINHSVIAEACNGVPGYRMVRYLHASE